ncbi:hypothetical protein SDJN03_16982, partial [Cucurbita argyrosperma subsp. sororia]
MPRESLDYCCLADRHLGGIRGYTRLEDDEKRSRVAEASDQTEAAKKRRKEKGNLKNDGVWRIASISGARQTIRHSENMPSMSTMTRAPMLVFIFERTTIMD